MTSSTVLSSYGVRCYVGAMRFQASKGQTISGVVSAQDIPMDLEVVNDSVFNYFGWWNNGCSFSYFGAAQPLLYAKPSMTQNYTAVIPESGLWWLVVGANGDWALGRGLNAVRWSWSANLTSPPYVTTTTQLTTVTNPMTVFYTQQLTFLQTQQETSQVLVVPITELYGGLAVTLAILFVIALVILFRQRTRKDRSKE